MGPSTFPPGLDEAAVEAAVRDAFDAWNGVDGAATVFATPTLDGELTDATTGNGTNEVVWEPLADDALARAHWQWTSGTPDLQELDVTLNPDHPWTVSPLAESDAYDVTSVLAHELGHCALLDVTDAPEQTMYFETAAGERKKRTPAGGDRNGWRDAYG
ncbi:MAG: matrixin family metalloprotease [Halobacteriaceae archaeon]